MMTGQRIKVRTFQWEGEKMEAKWQDAIALDWATNLGNCPKCGAEIGKLAEVLND